MANITLGCPAEFMGAGEFFGGTEITAFDLITYDDIKKVMGGTAPGLIAGKAWMKSINNIVAMLEGVSFSKIQPYINSLATDILRIISLTSDPQAADSVTRKGELYAEKIGEIWLEDVEKNISAFELEASIVSEPEQLQSILNRVQSYKEKMVNWLIPFFENSAGVQEGLRVIQGAQNRIGGRLNQLQEKKLGIKSTTSTYTNPNTGFMLSPTSYKWTEGMDEEQTQKKGGMGLALPLALAAGGVGLFLALRG